MNKLKFFIFYSFLFIFSFISFAQEPNREPASPIGKWVLENGRLVFKYGKDVYKAAEKIATGYGIYQVGKEIKKEITQDPSPTPTPEKPQPLPKSEPKPKPEASPKPTKDPVEKPTKDPVEKPTKDPVEKPVREIRERPSRHEFD